VPEILAPHELVPMDLFTAQEPLLVDLVYTDKTHPDNIFKEALYHDAARLFLHKDLARIVVAVARKLHGRHYRLVLKDGLRTMEAQEAMGSTAIVKANPHWLGDMVSRPGVGAHPRAMAIDVALSDGKGSLVDMGTTFDTMTPQSARSYDGFSAGIMENRKLLEGAFVESAARYDFPMLPLPSEWWDFRFPRSYYERWAPLSDSDLPPEFRMASTQSHTGEWQERFDKSAKEVLNSL
jgi:D-alanyl-D-alanine dipeptidase